MRKQGLCAQNTPLRIMVHISFTVKDSVNCIRFPMKCCINGENLIRLLYLSAKLFKFEIQKFGQILCAHKPYFLMPGHIFCTMYLMV